MTKEEKKGKKADLNGLPPAMREFEMAFQEFFKDKPKPKNDEEDKKQMEEFADWYNNTRKQSDTRKTPNEMYQEIYGKKPQKNPTEASRIMNFKWDENYKEPDEMLYEADRYFLKGKYKEAIELLDEVLEICLNDKDALLFKVEVLTAMGNKKEAEEILEFVSKKYGKDSFWHFDKAMMYFWNGNLSKAIDTMKMALEKDPNNFDAVIGYANYLYLTKDDSYVEYLEKARKLDSKRTKRFERKYWISQKEFVKGKFIPIALENIMDLLESSLEENAMENIQILLKYSKELPKDIFIMLLGLESEDYIVKKDYETANKKIEFMLKEDSNNPHAYFYKSQVLFNQNSFQEALKEIDVCLEKSEKMAIPHPDFLLLKSMILKKLDDDSYLYFENKAKQLTKGLKEFQKKGWE